MKVLVLFIVALTLTSVYVVAAGKSMRLRDIDVLTFSARERTQARRNSPSPQLVCIRGSACGDYKMQPTVVQCKKQGLGDTGTFQWKCEAELDQSVQFGRTDVVCEGYSYAGDDEVLKGSCFLEYELEYTNRARARPAASAIYDSPQAESESSGVGKILFILFLTVVIYAVFCRPGVRTATAAAGHGRRQRSSFWPFSFGSRGAGSSYPTYGSYTGNPYTGSSSGASCSPAASEATATESSGPGFWTGAALGGAAGYFAGRRSATNATSTAASASAGSTAAAAAAGAGVAGRTSESSSETSGGTRKATGYGTTKVR